MYQHAIERAPEEPSTWWGFSQPGSRNQLNDPSIMAQLTPVPRLS
ncbi:MAG: hypothetical protein OXM02_02070 [Bacteroidota bacterium]|nr:hypothetical protein [Bacteroidota bacterium]